jgi:hypothetical protein
MLYIGNGCPLVGCSQRVAVLQSGTVTVAAASISACICAVHGLSRVGAARL